MDRGKSSLEKDIILMLNDIKYFRDLSGTDIFEYTIGDGKVNPYIIDYDIQEKLLERMNDDGIIKIIKRKQVLSPTLSWVDEPLASRFSHTVYTLDTSKTSFPEKPAANYENKKVELSFDSKNGNLTLIVDGMIMELGRLNYGQDPYLIMETLFNNAPGTLINRNDISFEDASSKDLSRIISRSKLKSLAQFGLIMVGKRTVSRPLSPIVLRQNEINDLLSKTGKNWQKHKK